MKPRPGKELAGRAGVVPWDGPDVREPSAQNDLGQVMRCLSDWMKDYALPHWASVGVDGPHGFVEHFAPDGRPADVPFKRLRVQARQIYVFSHAYVNGYTAAIDAAANGWRFMQKHGWSPGGNWARVLGRNGGIRDATADLYDHSFALLGIAWWIRASGEDALPWAERTLEAIDRHLSTSWGIGWWSEEGPRGALLQNPHMHLLEGCLAAYATTGAASFKAYGQKVVSLFETRLFDPATGTLAEYFDDQWHRATGDRGRLVEPGHHYEWVWLLCRAAEWVAGPTQSYADELFTFAERFGCSAESGLVYDEVWCDGSIRRPSHRLWPNTEALKAHLARFETRGIVRPDRLLQILSNLVSYYVGVPTRETWIDQLDAQRRPIVDKIPASALYHLHLAIAEMERVAPALRAVGVLVGD